MTAEPGHTAETITTLVIESVPVFRWGLATVLERCARVGRVIQADGPEQALEACDDLSPDVIYVSSAVAFLPYSQTGSTTKGEQEFIRVLRKRSPKSPVVVMTVASDDDEIFQALRMGAADYLLYTVEPALLFERLDAVDSGTYLINETVTARPAVARRVITQFNQLPPENFENIQLFVPLSPREMQILDQVARGSSNKEIARTLEISDQTVKNHITSILRKLQVNDRTQAVVYALKKGWLKLPQE